MKNLLIFTGPNRSFNDETQTLVKIQIDNSIDLGWNRKDILLITDFPYNYNGVKSQVIEDGIYYPFDATANKIAVVIYLLNNNLIESNEIYWCHDFDAYQQYPIKDDELGLSKDIGLTRYTYKPEWQLGSFFFKKDTIDIFELLDRQIRLQKHASRNDVKELTRLIRNGLVDSNRFTKLNSTYNFTKRYIQTIYRIVSKPILVLHFHPNDKDALMKHTAQEIFMYGKNRLNIPLMNNRLIKIFNHHGIS